MGARGRWGKGAKGRGTMSLNVGTKNFRWGGGRGRRGEGRGPLFTCGEAGVWGRGVCVVGQAVVWGSTQNCWDKGGRGPANVQSGNATGGSVVGNETRGAGK